MRLAIIDSSVYIGHWEYGEFDQLLDQVRQLYVIRYSAVVLSELRRGARTRAAQKLVTTLFRGAGVVWAPTAEDWWQAGHVVMTVGERQRWDTAKRREFQNDALIALTARRHGATVVTANRGDFMLLAEVTGVHVLTV